MRKHSQQGRQQVAAMNMAAPTVYSYLRFSDPKQKTGQSTDRQLALAQQWAASRGYVLDASLSMRDEGLSAYHARHVKSGALGTFMAAIEAGRIEPGSILLVEQFDRLSRQNPFDAQAQLTRIINAGVRVVTTTDGKEYSRESLARNPYDLVMSIVLMIRAFEDSEIKSKRVTSSIRGLCQRWQEGTFRGVIRNGAPPAWVTWDKTAGKWELDPERLAAVRMTIDLYMQGYSGEPIVERLRDAGLPLTRRGKATDQTVYRLVRSAALIGEFHMTLNGANGPEDYVLRDYYPAVLSRVEWDELQQRVDSRVTQKSHPSGFVQVLTGHDIFRCGYCGLACVSQVFHDRPRDADGRVKDYNRRYYCIGKRQDVCPVAGSGSIAPIERAVMSYCSDLLNLRALYGGDRTDAPRARIAAAHAAIAEIEKKLDRLVDALAAGESPTITKRINALEAEQRKHQAALATAEREAAAVARNALAPSIDKKFKALRIGVDSQDNEARMKARRLIADTFESIRVYRLGVHPDETPDGCVDLVLQAKGGVARVIRIERDTGKWVAEDDIDPRP